MTTKQIMMAVAITAVFMASSNVHATICGTTKSANQAGSACDVNGGTCEWSVFDEDVYCQTVVDGSTCEDTVGGTSHVINGKIYSSTCGYEHTTVLHCKAVTSGANTPTTRTQITKYTKPCGTHS